MKFSVIIVNYNTSELLRRCLDSLISNFQSADLQKEIIIIDNNSSDGSWAYLKNLEVANYKIKVVRNKENLGFAKAVNQGIKEASGEFVLFLNTDTEVKKGSIKKLIRLAKRKKTAGIVAPQLINKDGSLQASCYHFPTIPGAIKKFWLGDEIAFGKYLPNVKKSAAEVDAAVAAVWLVTRKTIDKVGLFDERYFMYFEDLDYCRRVNKAGLKVYYLPTSQFLHLHGASGKKISSRTNKWLIESSKKYHGLLKYYFLTFIIRTGQIFNKLFKVIRDE